MPSMLLSLVSVVVTLWVSRAHGQETTCDPPAIANGLYAPHRTKYGLEAVITYRCDDGLYPSSPGNKRRCTEGGWARPPSCIFASCEYPEIKHGDLYWGDRYKGYFPASVGRWFYYFCVDDYVTPLEGNWSRIICTPDGWSPKVPCLRKCVFNYLENGYYLRYEQNYLQGEPVKVNCHPGYNLPNQQTTVTCTENGWSPSPKCIPVKKECIVPDIEENLIAQPQKDKYLIGDVLKFSCRQRLKLVGPDSTQCYNFGWSPDPPTCKAKVKLCGVHPHLPNGKATKTPKEEYEHGEVVEYVCDPRFLLKGSKKIQCVDGEWTTLPRCIEENSTCEGTPGIVHGSVNSQERPYHHGESVEFSCREGFTLAGPRSVTCLKGKWTPPPECIETGNMKTCKLPRSHEYKTRPSYKVDYNHSERVNYTCGRRPGQRHSVCVNGRWDPEVSCGEVPRCPPPPQIPKSQNMTTTVNYQEGETISILCQDNFMILEEGDLVCQGGIWKSVPRCIESERKCGAPPTIDNGDITTFPLAVYTPGDSVEYQCKAYYKLQGNRIIACHDGEWSEPPKCLEPCVILEEMMEKHNIRLKWSNEKKLYARTDDTLEFECQSGYGTQSPQSAFRVTCREGKLTYPTCE